MCQIIVSIPTKWSSRRLIISNLDLFNPLQPPSPTVSQHLLMQVESRGTAAQGPELQSDVQLYITHSTLCAVQYTQLDGGGDACRWL